MVGTKTSTAQSRRLRFGKGLYTYILHSRKKTLGRRRHLTNTGYTVHLRNRLQQHNGLLAGGGKATRSGRPWEVLLCVVGFNNATEARSLEGLIKSRKTPMCAKIDERVKDYGEMRSVRKLFALLSRAEWSHVCVVWHPDVNETVVDE